MAGSFTMVASHTARASEVVLEYKVAKQDGSPSLLEQILNRFGNGMSQEKAHTVMQRGQMTPCGPPTKLKMELRCSK